LLRWVPRLVFMWLRVLVGASLLIHACGALLFRQGLLLELQPRQLPLMIAGRLLGGIGQGMVEQVARNSAKQLHTGPEIGSYMLSLQFTCMTAIGFGPFVAVLLHTFSGTSVDFSSAIGFDSAGFQVVPAFQIVATLVAFLYFLGSCPDSSAFSQNMHVESCEGDTTDKRALRVLGVLSLLERKLLLASSVVIFSLRCFSVAAVETSTALLLHRDAGMHERCVGMIIGACFLMCIPLNLLHAWTIKGLAFSSQFYIYASFASLGCILLSKKACQLLFGWWTIVIADCLVFPCMYMADAIVVGVAFRHSLPQGNFLDSNTFSFLCLSFGCGCGRLLGPWVSRWQLETEVESGQDMYALLQVVCSAAAVVIFSLAVSKDAGEN